MSSNPVRVPGGQIVQFICLVGADGLPVQFPSGQVPTGLPVGFQQLQTADLAVAVGMTIPFGATMAICQAEGGDVRWRTDGPAPTGSNGFLLESGESENFIANLAKVLFIASTGQNAVKLNIGYYAQ